MNLEVGSTIGDYQVIGILGAGGMGKVYKVRNVISDRVEAMKVLLPDLATAPELADRFVREIKVLASLEHPHIASLRTALRVENQLLMLMEFVEGETLEQKLRAGRLPVAQAVDYISQAVAALGYAHQRGVIHRDFKPANMMLTPEGTIKLLDFGIAKSAGDRRLTMTGFTMGSLYYMSPEQIQGATTLDARSDLYSVGVSLYELVTGKRPFDGDSQFAIMSAHLQSTPVPPLELDPTLPAALNDLILQSVAKDPAQRFQTAEAFRNALASVAPAQPAAPPAPQQDFRLIQPTQTPALRSYRGLWMTAGGLAAVVAIVAVIQFGPWKSTRAGGGSPAPATPAAAAPAPATAPAQTPPVQIPPVQESPPAVSQSAAPAPASPPAASPKPDRPKMERPRVTPPSQTAPSVPAKTATEPPRTAPVSPPPQAAPAAQPPAEDPAKRVELQQLREQLAMLGARATACRDGLNSLARGQAASGMGLRGDMVEAASLMNSYLDGSNRAINAGDAPAAKDFLQKAERQVEKIEKFLGR